MKSYEGVEAGDKIQLTCLVPITDLKAKLNCGYSALLNNVI